MKLHPMQIWDGTSFIGAGGKMPGSGKAKTKKMAKKARHKANVKRKRDAKKEKKNGDVAQRQRQGT